MKKGIADMTGRVVVLRTAWLLALVTSTALACAGETV